MHQFKIDNERLGEIRKSILLKLVPLMVLISIVSTATSIYKNRNESEGLPLLVIIILPIIIACFVLYRVVSKQTSALRSFTISIEDTDITRRQEGLPTLTLNRMEIKEIIKSLNGSLTIVAHSGKGAIIIPAQVERYDELERLLSGFSDITVKSKPAMSPKYNFLIIIAVVLLMATVLTSYNKWLVGIGGTVLITLLIYSLVKIQTSNVIDKSVKKKSWLVLIVIASIIGQLYFKLLSSLPGM